MQPFSIQGDGPSTGRAGFRLSYLLFHLLCFPALAAADEAPSSAPGFMRRIAQSDNPAADGWPTEAMSRQLGKHLAALKHGVLAGADLEWVAPEFAGPALRPAMTETFADDALKVRLVKNPPASADHKGQAGFAQSWNDSWPPESVPDSREAHVKIILISQTAAGWSTTIRVEREADTTNGRACQSSRWRCEWSGKDAPELTSLTVEECEEAERAGGRLFRERTATLIGDTAVLRAQLKVAQPVWQQTLDWNLTLQGFGHHGIAVGDINGDGLDDVYVCQPAGLPNRLFLHAKDGRAIEAALDSGVDWLEPTQAALFADFDNDGDQDLALTIEQDVMLQTNKGRGQFSAPAILCKGRNFTSLAAADYDNDGDLDLYACAYYPERAQLGRLPQPAPYFDARNGGRDALLRNDTPRTEHGAETKWMFTDTTKESGIEAVNNRWTFAAAWEDFDDDGDPDLVCANDFGRANLFLNRWGESPAEPTFKDIAREVGMENSNFGMSTAWGDYDRDGHNDLYLAGMFSSAGSRIVPQAGFRAMEAGGKKDTFMVMARGNSLFRNTGGKLEDRSVDANVNMGRWAWATRFADLNNDGWEDILVANGWLSNALRDDL